MKVLHNVRDMSHDEWVSKRSNGIGGSDASAVLGVNPWKTTRQVWREKVTGESDFKGNTATRIGSAMEPHVLEMFAEDYNKAVVTWPVILQSSSHDWQLANIDAWIVEPCEKYPAGRVSTTDEFDFVPLSILEIKTTGLAGRPSKDWLKGQVPVYYLAQGCHYASVTGVNTVTFCCYVGGHGLVVIPHEFSEREIYRLENAEYAFWLDVIDYQIPEATAGDLEDLSEEWPEREGEIEADDDFYEVYQEFKRAKEKADEADREMRDAKALLLDRMGPAQAVTKDGHILVTYKAQAGRESIDTKRLKAEMPEVFERFAKSSNGFRVLRTYE